MAAIHSLLEQVQDKALRDRLTQEINRLTKNKKFGLVFEEHLPECTPLYNLPIKVGSTVAKRGGAIDKLYKVISIENNIATCIYRGNNKETERERERETLPLDELVCTAKFGEPIYPYLKPLDSICNAPDSDLWHTLIEADNYHALQLLEYLYAGKVDCIYIDPPYNTGAKDWKYNNNYVDSNDAYRHSKWLSFMKKRLKLAKKILSKDGVLICAINQYEAARLALLLEEIFPRYLVGERQEGKFFHDYITVVHNPRGQQNDNISYVHETLIYIYPSIKGKYICDVPKNATDNRGLRDSGTSSDRTDAKTCFYPFILVNGNIVSIGDVPQNNFHPNSSNVICSDGSVEVWPIDTSGNEKKWRYSRDKVESILDKLFIKNTNGVYSVIYGKSMGTMLTLWQDAKYDASEHGTKFLKKLFCEESPHEQRFSFAKSIYAVQQAVGSVVSNKPNALVLDFFAGSGTTLHAVNLLNAEDGGKRRCILVTNNEMSGDEADDLKKQGILPGTAAYSERGIARYVTWPRTTCSIKGVDINGQPLSGEYITSQTEIKESKRKFTQLGFVSDLAPLKQQQKKQIVSLIDKSGKLPQKLVEGDCPFIVSQEHEISILFDDSRLDDYLEALEGQEHIKEFFIVTSNNKLFNTAKKRIAELLGAYKENVPLSLPMKDGFKANAMFFQLGFLDKNNVELGRSFKELLPILWMKSGAVGVCPSLDIQALPHYILYPQNRFAVLINESRYAEFKAKLADCQKEISTVFFVTDSAEGFTDMAEDVLQSFGISDVYQLYKDYLDNFRINVRQED